VNSDGLEQGLGPDAYRVLSQWSAQQGLRHDLDRFFDTGGTAAKVAIVDRHDSLRKKSRKLVLKLDRVASDEFALTEFALTEYARHFAATWTAQDFARRHLAELVNDPIRVGDGYWLTFQSIAGDLGEFEALSSPLSGFLGQRDLSCDAASFGAICQGIVRGVLADLAGDPEIGYFSVPEFLRMHLSYRLDPGKPLPELIRSSTDEAFALLRDESLADGITVAAPIGTSHGDLHVENVLVRLRPQVQPDDFRLIDLANYQESAPLGRDPAHLLMHMVNRSLQWLGHGQAEALREVLLDPASIRGDQLPPWLRHAITGIYQAGEEWIGPSGFRPDWRRDRPLSLYVATLMVYVRHTTRPEDRAWLLGFATDAARQFLDSTAGLRTARVRRAADLARGPADPGRSSPRQPPRPRLAQQVGAEKFVVGRTAELAIFNSQFAVPDVRRVLNIYGPGGIGKSVVFTKMIRHAREGGVLVGAADVSAHGSDPVEILREMAASLAECEPAEPLQELLGQLEIYDAVSEIVQAGGGVDGMFETVGTVKDQAALRACLDACEVALPEQIREMMRNRFSLERYLRTSGPRLTTMLGDSLGALLSGRRGALLLDTYEDVRILDVWVRRSLLPTLPEGMRLVILGRNVLTKQNVDWLDNADTIQPRALPELAEDEAKTYLRHYGLTDPAALDHIYHFTGGYPLLLMLVSQLAEETGGWAAVGEMEHRGDRDLIASRLLERILREERVHEVRDVLEKCAIAAWINPEIIEALLGVTDAEARDLFEKVRRHSFMERHPEGVRLHEKIRDLLIGRLKFTSQSEFDLLEGKLLAYHAAKSSGLSRVDD
jgi:hypothetical protein